MALPPLATIDDLTAWLGSEPSNEDRAEAILAAASTLVRSHTGRTWVGADGEPNTDLTADDLEVAKTVVVTVAARVWTNPNGTTQQTAGPYSQSVAAWAALGLELTKTEKNLLAGFATAVRPALWTQSTTRGDHDVASVYVDVVGSDKPLPVSREPW